MLSCLVLGLSFFVFSFLVLCLFLSCLVSFVALYCSVLCCLGVLSRLEPVLASCVVLSCTVLCCFGDLSYLELVLLSCLIPFGLMGEGERSEVLSQIC